jgi:hypothetical protein
VEGNTVRDLIPLSPARLCNKIDVGDIVIAVDDKDVDASKVLEALRGSDKVGSECQITLKKQNGSQHKVALNRISTLEVFDIKVIMNNFIKMQSDVNRKVQDPEAQANMLQTIKDTRIVWESTLMDAYEVQAYHLFSVPAAFVPMHERSVRVKKWEWRQECTERLSLSLFVCLCDTV